MTDRIGIGVVGTGSLGMRVLAHLAQPDVQDRTALAAVCDAVPGRAKAAAEKFDARRAYESYDELLADPEVHAITLATPIGLHYQQGLSAIRAGKHVHFNKTMTTTAAEAQQLIAEAKERGVKLVASPGQMIQTQNRVIRKMIADGALGKLAWAMVGCAFGTYHETEPERKGDDVLSNVNPSWYWRKPGGGPLYDMTVYGLHTLTGILGPARRVTAMSGVLLAQREFRGQSYPCDADDNTLMVLDFGDNCFAFVYGTAAGSITREFGQPDFFGTAGVIRGTELNGKPIDFPGRELAAYQRGPHITGVHRDLNESHVFEDVMQLVDYVREGKPPVGTAEHAAHVVEIIEAGYKAAETGKTQALVTTFTPVEVD